ncbi:MFS transporter [Alcaligenaceae bacterium CGII-47]|nr:MFS transporter [Alcaligenaceae bacterium CGII-47]
MTEPNSDFNMRQIALAIFGPSLLFGLGEGAIFPILALNATALGASEAWAGLIVALIGIGSLLSNIPAAILTDRFGERRAMIGAATFSLAALALCIVAHRPWVLGVGTFMIGMATSVFMLARQTYLIEAIPLVMRARALSTLGGTMRIGMFAGPFIAAAVMHVMGLVGAYWVAVIAIFGAGVLSYFVPDLEAAPRQRGASSVRVGMASLIKDHAHVYITLGIAVALVQALRACRQIVIPLWADQIGLDATTTAIIYGIMGGVDMLLFYPAGRVMDTYGRRWIAIPSMLIMGVSLMLMPWTVGVASLLIISMVLGLGNGIGSGLVMTVGADASPNRGRTQFLGIWRFIADLGTGGGPLLLSAVTAIISLSAGIASIGVLGLVAAGMFWRWLPSRAQS